MTITELPDNEIPDDVPQDANTVGSDVSFSELLEEAGNASDYNSKIEGMN